VSKNKILGWLVLVGVFVGLSLLWVRGDNGAYGLKSSSLDEETWKPFFETIDFLREKFIGGTSFDETMMMEEAIRGVLRALDDPYARYLDKEDFAIETDDRIEGEFSGLGIVIAIKDDKLTVISPIKGAPAEKAGVKAGDVIVAIDGESTAGIALDRAVKKMRGAKGTKVVLTLQREGVSEEFEVEIIRDIVSIQSVEYEIREGDIGIIRISEFHGKTFDELRNALFALQDAGVAGLVIDLRDNPGGLLPSAILCSGIFVPQGRELLWIEDRNGAREVVKNFMSPLWDRPLVVLVNKGTASGAEIMAGILRMILRTELIGEKTFGKGVVQEIFPLSHGGGVIFTVSRYLLADGTNVDRVGLQPDTEVAGEEEQLATALKKIKELLGSNAMAS